MNSVHIGTQGKNKIEKKYGVNVLSLKDILNEGQTYKGVLIFLKETGLMNRL